jgi:hypothetical protein
MGERRGLCVLLNRVARARAERERERERVSEISIEWIHKASRERYAILSFLIVSPNRG